MRETTAPLATTLETTHQVRSPGVRFLLVALTSLVVACGPQPQDEAPSEEGLSTQAQAVQNQNDDQDDDGDDGERRPATPPIGLALAVENGQGTPLTLRANQPYYVNIIDLRASMTATKDEGVNGLDRTGDFSGLGWGGLKMAEQAFEMLAGPEGYKRRRFYRDAAWMNLPSYFMVEQVDKNGILTALPIILNAGTNDRTRDDDDFFVRRFRAIQWTYDCTSLTNCAGANDFQEEALVELRNARTPCKSKVFTLNSRTKALRVRWSLRPVAPYTIPVQQDAHPAYDYGFNIDVKALTPPRADGTYAPGAAIQFQLTLKDGAGRRLHPQGSLPTYNQVIDGAVESGIQYYNAFFDPTTTYYRRKHRERMLMTQIIGPAQLIQPIRSIVEMADFLAPNDVQTLGTFERDGVFSQFQTFPPGNDLFGGAFDPAHLGWAAPVSDKWTYQLPANAVPGTYLVTVKGRRVYMGEDLPASTTIEIQVGTKTRTTAPLTTGPCNSCHSQGGELANVLHGNDNRAACAGCHAPLGFELEGPIFVRVHFIHSRSDRVDADLAQCSKCHLNNASIQRTSKAACFSCHKTWTKQHEDKFGPIQHMYVGGGRESFQQCTSTCHTTHPKSGL
ncbi:cytochrome c3 family protein [Hyalangium versicolor]|uniref:cytochrome c3 family protein n=1 Tax=Hyalangium versicolor TaxID=2861190 RepID=UPI001CCC964A|nr:cytochrome c3 family protein [Hyalangium versicolor]